jgi:hypothetical protein
MQHDVNNTGKYSFTQSCDLLCQNATWYNLAQWVFTYSTYAKSGSLRKYEESGLNFRIL